MWQCSWLLWLTAVVSVARVNSESFLHIGWRPTTDICSSQAPNLTRYGLEVHLARTITLLPPAKALANAGHAFAFRNGAMNVLTRYGANKSYAIRSMDGGRTWQDLAHQAAPFEERSTSEVRTEALQRSSGEVIWFSGFTSHARDGANGGQDFMRQPNGSVQVELLRSNDSGLTQISELALLWLPLSLDLRNLQHAVMVELPDKSLISIAYAHWTGIDGFAFYNGQVMPKDRTFVMRSDDNGHNWRYLSTVASDPSNNTDACVLSSDGEGTPPCAVIEGFNEPWLTVTPHPTAADGVALVALMRSGGSLAVQSGIVSGPLYRSISVDGGLTWGIVQPVANRGVAPTVAMTKSKVLVASYGRPGNFLMFSTDGGVSFFGHWCYKGAAAGSQYDGSEYDSIALVPSSTVDDGTEQVMVTYANCTSTQSCSAMASFVRIKRLSYDPSEAAYV